MISYRSIKRLLGETSLERKCRFLFGGGLMLLISGSFYFYASMTETLVDEQNLKTARTLVRHVFREEHLNYFNAAVDAEEETRDANTHLRRKFERAVDGYFRADLNKDEYNWNIRGHHERKPADQTEWDLWDKLIKPHRRFDEVVRDLPGENRFVYAGALRASRDCLECHRTRDPDLAEGDLLGMVTIYFSLTSTDQALARNNAILLATAIVTAFLAMLSAYAIVRYVIVKPVLHLKDVSDEIARGNLELRADIHTGDEFEELSHAFNRMLRHMMTTQDELRALNTDLDGKIDELAQVNLQLYETNKLKDDFLATMSHELRTPLNSILGFSDILSEAENLNERQQRYLSNIRLSGQGLMTQINDLLDLAKIESGKMDVQAVEFAIPDIIERQTAAMMPLAGRKNIDLSWICESEIPVLLQDPGKMQQILNNLLSNAIKFTPEGGRVRVMVRMPDDVTIEIIVEDSGIGIALHEQDTIFEKFRQGTTVPGDHNAMTREYEGTGLGLSIVRELARLLGGDVFLQSEFGKGSTFTVRLPVRVPIQLLESRSPISREELRERMVGLNRRPSVHTDTQPTLSRDVRHSEDSIDTLVIESDDESSDESAA